VQALELLYKGFEPIVLNMLKQLRKNKNEHYRKLGKTT
jgi:hypothetical protein